MDVGTEVSSVCGDPSLWEMEPGWGEVGAGSGCTSRDEGRGAGTPSSVAFHCRTRRSLRILKLAFQVSVKLICQGKKVGHILFNSLLAWFITYRYLDMWDSTGPLAVSPQMFEAGLASSALGSVKKMGELVQNDRAWRSPSGLYQTP